MTIGNELIDELLAGCEPSSVMRQDGLLGELKKALLNRLMAAEFEHHLTQDRATGEGKNHRNGSSRKRVLTDGSQVEVTVPRDREARFDPVLIGKYQRRLPGFDDKVISLYTRGMSTREIQGHLEEIYGAEVSPQLISTVLRDNQGENRIASPEMLPLPGLLPHLICSPPVCIGGGGHGADQHGDTRRVGGCVGGTLRLEQPEGARPYPGRIRGGERLASQARDASAPRRAARPTIRPAACTAFIQ